MGWACRSSLRVQNGQAYATMTICLLSYMSYPKTIMAVVPLQSAGPSALISDIMYGSFDSSVRRASFIPMLPAKHSSLSHREIRFYETKRNLKLGVLKKRKKNWAGNQSDLENLALA